MTKKPLTRNKILELYPWMREIEAISGAIQPNCPDCNTGLGQTHSKNCDIPRNTITGIQRIQDKTPETFEEIWIGIPHPHAHKAAWEENLFYRDLLIKGEETTVMHSYNAKEIAKADKVLWEQPCQKNDDGAKVDINKGSQLAQEQKSYKIPLEDTITLYVNEDNLNDQGIHILSEVGPKGLRMGCYRNITNKRVFQAGKVVFTDHLGKPHLIKPSKKKP